MKLRDTNLHSLKEQDARMRVIKERRFRDLDLDDWIVPIIVAYFVGCAAFLGAVIGLFL